MKRSHVKFIITEAGLIALLILWKTQDMQFCGNIFKFLTVFTGIAYGTCNLIKHKDREDLYKAYRNGSQMPEWADIAFYSFIVLALSGYGHYVYATWWLITGATDLRMRELAMKK